MERVEARASAPAPSLEQLLGASDYALRHLAEHLQAAGELDRLELLLVGGPAWMEAKFARLSGDTAYLDDLRLAGDALPSPPRGTDAVLAVELELARAVVNERAKLWHADDALEALVWLGREAEAKSYARLHRNSNRALVIVFRALAARGTLDEGLLREIEDAARGQSDDPWGEVWRLVQVAHGLRSLGDPRADGVLDRAVRGAEDITAEVHRSIALAAVASELCDSARLGEALRAARKIPQDFRRAEGLLTVAAALIAADDGRADGVLAEATATALAVEAGMWSFRPAALAHTAAMLARAGRIDQAARIARELSWEAHEDARRAAEGEIARAMIAASDPRAETVISDIERQLMSTDSAQITADALAELGGRLAEVDPVTADGLFARAEQAAVAAEDEDALGTVALACAAAGRLDTSLRIAERIETGDLRGNVLQTLAAAMARTGHPSAADVLEQARLALVRSERSQTENAQQALVRALATLGAFEQALSVAATFPSAAEQSRAHASIAKGLSVVDQQRASEVFAQAAELGRQAVSEGRWSYRGKPAYFLALALAESGRIEEAQQSAAEIEEAEQRSEAMVTIVRSLADAGRLDEARALAAEVPQREEDPEAYLGRDYAFEYLALAYARGGWADEAEESVRAVGDPDNRAVAMLEAARTLAVADLPARAVNLVAPAPDGAEKIAALSAIGAEWARYDRSSAEALIDRALRAARALVSPSEASAGLAHVGAAVATTGENAEADELFAEAESIAYRIPANGDHAATVEDRGEALGAVAGALSAAGRFESARSLAKSARSRTGARVLQELAEDLAGRGDPRWRAVHDEADELGLAPLGSDRSLAMVLAQVGQVGHALRTGGTQDVDTVIESLAELSPTLGSHAENALRQAVRVAGWVNPDWRVIANVIAVPPDTPAPSPPHGGNSLHRGARLGA